MTIDRRHFTAFRWAGLIVVGSALILLGLIPTSHAAADRDCADFDTQAAAQSYFLSIGGPQSDPDLLDADHDGVACEDLPCPCSKGSAQPFLPTPEPAARVFEARVSEVVDGDTLKVGRGGSETEVRMLGIDTPEVYFGEECGGPQASASMHSLADGYRVRVRTDPTQPRHDHFGRLLAYVRRLSDGLDLDRAQLARGLAKVDVVGDPFRRVELYRQVQAHARAAGYGVWSLCDGSFNRPLE